MAIPVQGGMAIPALQVRAGFLCSLGPSSAHETSALPAQGPWQPVSGQHGDVHASVAQPPTRYALVCADAVGWHRAEETRLIPS